MTFGTVKEKVFFLKFINSELSVDAYITVEESVRLDLILKIAVVSE